uniref:Putative serine/threonine protein kinase rio3 n=1 Tax=Ixodes ricinus TaxID=34613 RepID=A0A0K8RBB6_IXORI
MCCLQRTCSRRFVDSTCLVREPNCCPKYKTTRETNSSWAMSRNKRWTFLTPCSKSLWTKSPGLETRLHQARTRRQNPKSPTTTSLRTSPPVVYLAWMHVLYSLIKSKYNLQRVSKKSLSMNTFV